MAIDKRQVGASSIGAIGGLFFAFAVMFGFRGCVPSAPPTPDPVPLVSKGRHVIALVDIKNPTIPRGIVLDSPIFDALKQAGMFTKVDINEPFFHEQGYDELLRVAGGADALAILDDDGQAAFAKRLPTDLRAVEAILQKHVLNLPAPLPHSPKPQVVNRGGELQVRMVNGVPVVDGDGVPRMLSARPTDRALFASLPSYAANNPVFPEKEWPNIDRRNLFGAAEWVLNQGQVGSCVAQSWCNAFRKLRFLSGMEDVKFGPGYTYAKINGGRDEGAIISHGINALTKFGACPFDVVGQSPYFENQMPKNARTAAEPFKLQDAYRCDSWEELGSALATGEYLAVFGVMVGNTFGRFDKHGVCGHDPGPGNHALHADGMKVLENDGRRVLDVPNSWGYQWGPFKNGRCYLDREHLFGRGVQPDCCVLRLSGRNPNDANKPPKYRAKAGETLTP